MSGIFDALTRALGRKRRRDNGVAGPMTYEEARELARDDDVEVRRQLAQRSDARAEILYFLVDDPASEVRRQVAGNGATPARADLRLAADIDPAVRGDLAQKIARLAPGLSADEQDRVHQITYDALVLLARDQVTRVRQILAEALKDVAHAPPEVIRQLAHDIDLAVASPVLEFSPVLTDEDLIEIIQAPPASGVLSAISRRARVAPQVADAIAQSDDIDAIAVLLANPSAQIREETLDLLVERAPAHEAWHEPLVRRPYLSAHAAARLARFVAERLLQVLEERGDLDAATKVAVANAVRQRIGEGGLEMATFRRAGDAAGQPEKTVLPVVEAQGMGQLKEEVILEQLAANKLDFVVKALAARANVSATLVRKIAAARSPKGMTALVWRGGLSMEAAVKLQTRLARIAPDDVLSPRPGTRYAFPLDPADMNWQLEFFAAMIGEKLPPS